jgi:REP element-mobilizing transposase RayT
MPRQARLDAPGTLHHVIIRGIEQKEIVKDDHDRQNFVYRMGTIALETGTLIYVWTLMTNHTHIFLIRFRLYFDMVPLTPCRIVTIDRARCPIRA